jgi:hypothetical protein
MEQDNISISWKHLPWKKFQRKSFRLQCKIYEAKCCDSSRNVKRLQKLLIKSKSIYYLAVKKVTDYYYRKGLFLSSEIKLSLVYEIYSNIINWKYFLLESYVKKGFLSIKILKAKIVSSILEFLIEPFFLHFFYRYTKPKSLHSQFSLLKKFTLLFSLKLKENFLSYIKSSSFLLILNIPLKHKILRMVRGDFSYNLTSSKFVATTWTDFFHSYNKVLKFFWEWKNFKNECKIFVGQGK